MINLVSLPFISFPLNLFLYIGHKNFYNIKLQLYCGRNRFYYMGWTYLNVNPKIKIKRQNSKKEKDLEQFCVIVTISTRLYSCF